MKDIQWYPGHMTKARREMQENLKLVDLIIELIDARVPYSGRNPDIQKMGEQKARILILNKADLADPAQNTAWSSFYREMGYEVLALDSRERGVKKKILEKIRTACAQKLERDRRRGIRNSSIRAMVTGIPNVGKSTLINSLAGRASAKTGNKPGVTRGQQWIRLGGGIDLLDTPGILWPRFDDPLAGLKLAWIGSVRDEILQIEELALRLLDYLRDAYPQAVSGRYGTDGTREASAVLTDIAEARGCLRAGGEPDTEKAAALLLDEFRHALLGRITLEEPDRQNAELSADGSR